MNTDIYQQIRYALKDNADAVSFFFTLRDVLHFWDDLVDKDQRVSDYDINLSMFKALVALPRNKFYQENFTSLNSVLVNAIANWQAANSFEATDNDKLLEIAFIARSDYINLLIHCAYLVGGYDWMNEVTPAIRAAWTKENFAAYKDNLSRERAAKTGTQKELLSQWYEEETGEYLKHGLTVFNAAMLGESEKEHVAALVELIRPPKRAVVVDMGCGVGGVSRLMKEHLPEASFYGVTNVQRQIEAINDLGGVVPVFADYHVVPLTSGVADVVMFNESIGYGNLKVLLREASRLLKDGGAIAIKDGNFVGGEQVYDRTWMWTTHSKEHLEHEAKEIGLIVEKSVSTPYSIDRYTKFVADSKLMRDRYGTVCIDIDQLRPWFWLLRKQDTKNA